MNNSNKLRYSKSESNIDLQAVKTNSFTSLESSTNKYNSVETSILVCSSPELDYNVLEMHKYEENKKNTSGSYCKSSEDNSHVFENDTYLANAYIDNSDDNINTPLFTKKVNQLGKQIVFIVIIHKNNKLTVIMILLQKNSRVMEDY